MNNLKFVDIQYGKIKFLYSGLIELNRAMHPSNVRAELDHLRRCLASLPSHLLILDASQSKLASEENEASAAAAVPDDDEWVQWRKF
jgi:hypothetical protein